MFDECINDLPVISLCDSVWRSHPVQLLNSSSAVPTTLHPDAILYMLNYTPDNAKYGCPEYLFQYRNMTHKQYASLLFRHFVMLGLDNCSRNLEIGRIRLSQILINALLTKDYDSLCRTMSEYLKLVPYPELVFKDVGMDKLMSVSPITLMNLRNELTSKGGILYCRRS